MNARQRHQKILQLLSEQPIVSVAELEQALDTSIATVRRDINTLSRAKLVQKIRGGIEALSDSNPLQQRLVGEAFVSSDNVHVRKKRAIAREAVALCSDGEAIIINGGTTTHRMAEFMEDLCMHVLTNSFTMADHLLRRSRNHVMLPGGEVFREQNIVLSPYEEDTMSDRFYASKMFMGAFAVRQQGLIETDPLLIKAEQKLIKQTEELIVLVDSSKFATHGSLILCPLERVSTAITDEGVPEQALEMLDRAGVRVIVANSQTRE